MKGGSDSEIDRTVCIGGGGGGWGVERGYTLGWCT